jgi:dihydropteroate synthase
MGILNTSPESPVIHSIVSIKEAIKRAHILREHGASIIDVGGNSSSSKATDVWTPEVVLDAAKIGIHLINDINGLENPEMRKIAKDFDLSVSIMHMRGKPKKHYEVNQNYENISIEILNWLNDRANELRKFGIKKERIIIDPGFGFGKSSKDNFLILKNLHKYNDLDYPVLVSASRKSFISEAIGLGQVQEGSGLFEATLGVQVIAALQNVEILRVHDVKSTKSILKLLEHYKKF